MEPSLDCSEEVEQSPGTVVGAVCGGRHPRHFLQQFLPPGPTTVYEVRLPKEDEPSLLVRRAPDFTNAPPLLSARAVGHHVAAVTACGKVLCSKRPREGLSTVHLPWPAAVVSCGTRPVPPPDDDRCVAIALRRGGRSVRFWHLAGSCHGDAVPAKLKKVHGLPEGDPVVAIDSGKGIGVALTASGAAFGWGRKSFPHPMGARGFGVAVRIPQLCERRIRRLGCGYGFILAETEEGQVICVDLVHQGHSLLPTDGILAFPLRDWSIYFCRVEMLDAVGTVWAADVDEDTRALCPPQRLKPQPPPRTVRLARDWALTDSGEMWVYNNAGCWQNISAARPELPRGLLPHGGIVADRLLLLPDPSCGRHRMYFFARIAVRLRLPSDPLRVQLLRFTLQSCYIVGPEDDPFSWPSAVRPAAAVVAAAAERCAPLGSSSDSGSDAPVA